VEIWGVLAVDWFGLGWGGCVEDDGVVAAGGFCCGVGGVGMGDCVD